MVRTLKTELIDKGFVNKNTHIHQKKAKKNERLSRREIEELMGIRRDIFTRKGGAIRRK